MSRKGSVESVMAQPQPPKKKLWVNVTSPANRPSTYNVKGLTGTGQGGQKGNPLQAVVRPTVTTLLRHHKVLERDEQKEREKLDGILQGNVNFDFDGWKRTQEAVREKEAEAAQAKRRLKAKLAYHKAIAASTAMLKDKSEKAECVRDEGRRLREEVEAEQELEKERRRQLAAEVHNETALCKELLEKVQQEKRRQALSLKEETNRLQEEARRKEIEEMLYRKERIQQIQASKLAMRQANAHTLSSNAFLGALGSPDADIRLKLTKEAQKAELEQKRHKVQLEKKEREKKLMEVRERLEGRVAQRTLTREIQGKFRNVSLSKPTLPIRVEQDEEMKAMTKELENLRTIHNKSYKSRSRLTLNYVSGSGASSPRSSSLQKNNTQVASKVPFY